MIDEWEEENNVRIGTSTTWDEFTFFAGGHGDIVSMSTQETPVLEAETGIKTVTFGKYNYQRVPMFKRQATPTRRWPTSRGLEDLRLRPGRPTPRSGRCSAKEMHGLDYRVGGGDFQLIVNDHFVNPTNLLRGDCEAAAIIPEAAVPQMRKGELEMMYDGKSRSSSTRSSPRCRRPEARHVATTSSATEEWFDANPELVAKFLELWQQGVDQWKEQKGRNHRGSTRSTSRSSPKRTSTTSIDSWPVTPTGSSTRSPETRRGSSRSRRSGSFMKQPASRQPELSCGGLRRSPVRGDHPPSSAIIGAGARPYAGPCEESPTRDRKAVSVDR